MDMNTLNMSAAALRLNRAPLSQGDLLINSAIPPMINNYTHGYPRLYPLPTSTFKPNVNRPVAYDLVCKPAVPTRPQKSPNSVNSSNKWPSWNSDQPLDLSLKGKQTATATSTTTTSAVEINQTEAGGSTSGPLDLTKTKSRATTIADKPTERQVSASPDGSSGVAHLSNGRIIFRCTRCPFFCGESLDFQKHFSHAHKRIPVMNDVIISTGPSPVTASPVTGSSPVLVSTNVMSRDPKLSSPSSEVPSLHCSFCGWQCEISQSGRFNAHLEEHAKDNGVYRCFYCKNEYRDPHQLREHLAVHPGVNHYICSFCSMAFRSENVISAHMYHRHGLAYSHPPRPVTSERQSMSPVRPRSGSSSNHSDNRDSPNQKSSSAGSTSNSPVIFPSKEEGTDLSKSALVMKKTGFGQSLAKHIEAAISRELIGNKSPTVTDLMFMKSSPAEDLQEGGKNPPNVKDSSLNLMSLLDKVVEESLRKVPLGESTKKPDLKFMVTFSDEDESKENNDKSSKSALANNSSNQNMMDSALGRQQSVSSEEKSEEVVTSSISDALNSETDSEKEQMNNKEESDIERTNGRSGYEKYEQAKHTFDDAGSFSHKMEVNALNQRAKSNQPTKRSSLETNISYNSSKYHTHLFNAEKRPKLEEVE